MRKKITSAITAIALFSGMLFSGNEVFAQADAGVLNLISPALSGCAGDSIRAEIKNFGSVSITTLTVNWAVNGTAQTPVSYTSPLAAGDTDTITLGAFHFAAGPPYNIRVFTSSPNGGSDANAANDTLDSNGHTFLMNGSYTIGGTSPDYARFSDAVAALIANGVCGPVVFNIRPGTDTVQVVIPEISGADSTNTITFQSENGDSTSAILALKPDPAFTPTNYMIQLDGADYLVFHKLTMQRTGVDPYSRIIEFKDNATHNTISHCVLTGTVNNLTNSLASLIYSTSGSPSNDSMNTITNNRLVNGSLGIYMNGISSLNPETGLVISGNIFENQYSKGIQMQNIGAVSITGNTISSVPSTLGYAAIYLDRSQRNQNISSNKISNIRGTGIYMIDCSGYNGTPGIIANNFIQCSDSAGLSIINGDYQEFLNNSINLTGPQANYSSVFMRGAGTGKKLINNILVNSGGGYCYVVSGSAVIGIITSNFNNLFTTGSNVGNFDGTDEATLGDWISAWNKDSNSVSVDPRFVSTTDLHATAVAMDNLGTPLASVAVDIDNQLRSLTTPDIGADEYTGQRRDLGVTALLSPEDNTCGSGVAAVTLIVTNTGDYAETGFTVIADVTGSGTATITDTYPDTLQPGTSDTLTLTGTLNTSAGGTFDFTAYTSLPSDDDHSNDTLTASRTSLLIPAPPVAVGDSVCGAGTVTFTATASDTIYWYSVSSGGTPIGTGSPFTTPFNNATVTYYAANKASCSSDRVPVEATVLPLPTVNLGNDTSIIAGNTITFDAGAGFSAYAWNTGDTTQTLNTGVAGCYDVSVTNSLGCTNSDTVCLSVVQPGDVGITAIISPSNGDCSNASTSVIVNVTNFGSDSISGIPVAVDVTGSVTATLNGTVTDTIAPGDTLAFNVGSINTLGGTSFTLTAYTVYVADVDSSNDTLTAAITTVLAPPAPTGLGGARCGAGSIVISAISSDTIYWYDAPSGGNLLFTGNTYNIPFLDSTTTYYAQTGNVCPNQDRTSITATIYQLPSVNLGNDTVASNNIILDAGPGYVTYSWSPGGETTQTIVAGGPVGSQDYIVTVVDTNGCSNSDTITVTIILGLNQIQGIDGVRIYPNPANDVVTLEVSSLSGSDISVRLMDTKGSVLVQDIMQHVTGTETRDIPLDHLAAGVYFIRLISDQGTSMYRLVVN